MWPDRPLRVVLVALTVLAAACGSAATTGEKLLSEQLSTDEIVTDGSEDAIEPVEPATTAISEEVSGDDQEADAIEDGVSGAPPSAGAANASLGRGINIGNALEAPREGEWGAGLDASHFEAIADAGFSHVRLPISWSAYAAQEAPYSIPEGVDPSVDHPDYDNIWERIDWAIDQTGQNQLLLVLDMHHYDEIHEDPLAEEERFLSMWDQIATRYADAPEHVVFELLNEPNQTFDVEPRLWNELLDKTLTVVRRTNPNRPVIIGPVGHNSIARLDDLELPEDQHLIVTVHVYEPFDFTHQGAPWVDPVPAVGANWIADEATFPEGVVDYSWDTEVGSQGGSLTVDYDQLWAGFSIDYQRSISPTEVTFTVSGASNLKLVCRLPDGVTEVATLKTTEEPATYSYDLRGCSQDTTGIFIQTTESDPDLLLFDSLVMCLDRGCEEIVQTEVGVLDALLERAAAWGESNGVPMNIGEFGAYGADGAAPIDDRARWTAAVQEAATTRGMSTAYWEFHAGFGAYDLESESWHEPLRAALLD